MTDPIKAEDDQERMFGGQRSNRSGVRFSRPVSVTEDIRPFPPTPSSAKPDLPPSMVPGLQIAAEPIEAKPARPTTPRSARSVSFETDRLVSGNRLSDDKSSVKELASHFSPVVQRPSAPPQPSKPSSPLPYAPASPPPLASTAKAPPTSPKPASSAKEPVPLTPVRVHSEPKPTIVMRVGPEGVITETRRERPVSRLMARFRRPEAASVASNTAEKSPALDPDSFRRDDAPAAIAREAPLDRAEIQKMIEKTVEEYIALIAHSAWLDDEAGRRVSKAMLGVPAESKPAVAELAAPGGNPEPAKPPSAAPQNDGQVRIIDEVRSETQEETSTVKRRPSKQPAEERPLEAEESETEELAPAREFSPFFFDETYATTDSRTTLNQGKLDLRVELAGVVPELIVYPFGKIPADQVGNFSDRRISASITDETLVGRADFRLLVQDGTYVLRLQGVKDEKGEKLEFNAFSLPLTVGFSCRLDRLDLDSLDAKTI